MTLLAPARWIVIGIGLLAAIAMGLAILGGGSQPQASSACLNTTLTVGPDQASALQQLIDDGPDGSVLHLKSGTYPVNLLITRNLTLCGNGPQQTVLEGKPQGGPVVRIINSQVIQVALEGLTITQGSIGPGDDSRAGAVEMPRDFNVSNTIPPYTVFRANRAQVSLKHVKITANAGAGLGGALQKEGGLTLQDVEISDNLDAGILVGSDADVVLDNVRVINNGGRIPILGTHCIGGGMGLSVLADSPSIVPSYTLRNIKVVGRNCKNSGSGLGISGAAKVIGQNIQISNNGDAGLGIVRIAEASLTDVVVEHNGGWGVFLSNPNQTAQFTLKRTKISNNGRSGFYAQGLSAARLEEVTIEKNGFGECPNPVPRGADDQVCNGLQLRGRS
ncbi:right-handed parallel beta-helix repeat-containing protein [Candidatus Acetothermia bacterium]|nr:right-handed parallel beta-helix repeat-containing protein [Candidatus Acetothermia bacterium]